MTFKPQAPAPEPEPRPGVEVGDHLYVHHKGQPCSGMVKAHGKHGVTVEVDGQHHKVKWDKVLGHKTRTPQKYSILEEGEDGMLVDDGAGRRRFIATPNESKEDPMVAKSMGYTRPVLFMKSAAPGTYAGGPGLQKKQITDKRGVQTTKWVSTDKGGPPAQRGQHVGFANGEHKGHGEVTAAGKDGVRVKDGAGGEHLVTHDKITHHADGQGAPEGSPHEAPAPGTPKPQADGAEGIARALFNTSELDKLATKVPQPVSSWEELSAKAPEALQQFTDMLGKVAQTLNLQTGKRPQSLDNAVASESEKAADEKRAPKEVKADDYMLPEHWDDDRGYLFMGPLKGEERAREKVRTDYTTKEMPDGDWSQVRDMVRATIAVPMVTQIPQVLAQLKAAGIELAQKPKNNLIKPLPGGYRDLNLIVKLPNGLLAELQVHIKPMTLAKEKGHKPYETTRSIEGKYRENGVGSDTSKWEASDREKHGVAMKEQEKLYGDAWEKATTGGKKPDKASSNLTKSFSQPKIILWNFKGQENE